MVKVMYVEAKRKGLELEVLDKEFEKLPDKLIVAYSVQYKELAEKIKKKLLDNNKKVESFVQILGCSNIYNRKKLPVLLVSSGKFHARNLYLQAPIIYVLEGDRIIQINNNEIEKVEKERKVALMKFFNASKVGIIVSTKPGQENMNYALKLKKKIEKKFKDEKEVFLFVSDNIDVSQLENFGMDSWVNTACRGIVLDKTNVVNYDELNNL